MELTENNKAVFKVIAKTAAWQIKEDAMKRQFQQALGKVRMGQWVTVSFCPMDADHVYIYNAIIEAINCLPQTDIALAIPSTGGEVQAATALAGTDF
jgi:ATP-dependent protease ClpP protease subunit